MAKAKRPAKTPVGTKNPSLTDVSEPGKTSPSPTSRPVIVTHRPILKDPMVNHEDESPKPDKPALKAPSKRTAELESLSLPKLPVETEVSDSPDQSVAADEQSSAELKKEAGDQTSEDKADTKADKASKLQPKNDASVDDAVPSPPLDAKAARPDDEDEDAIAAQAKHDTSVHKLIETKKYFLTINSVEKRRAKHTLILGIGVSILLLLAWANIALDAGLITIDGVEPLTHFFSS